MRYIVFILLHICLLSNAFASQNENYFLMDVNSISLNKHKKKNEYFIHDLTRFYTNNRNLPFGFVHYPEVNSELKKFLIEKGFIISDYIPLDKDNYVTKRPNFVIYMTYNNYKPNFSLDARNATTYEPLWIIEVKLVGEYSSDIFRITLPVLVKCISPYFNKSYKGRIYCKY